MQGFYNFFKDFGLWGKFYVLTFHMWPEIYSGLECPFLPLIISSIFKMCYQICAKLVKVREKKKKNAQKSYTFISYLTFTYIL